MTLPKRKTHSVQSDRYISLMITSDTAKAGRFLRIPKFLISLAALLFVGIIAVIAVFFVRFEELNSNYEDISLQLEMLALDKASTEKLLSTEHAKKEAKLSTEISEREELISDLLISLEEKEEQLNTIESQASEMWSKIEELEAIKESIYNKLNEAPADIYEDIEETGNTTDPDDISAANITPYDVSVSLAGYDTESSSSISSTLSTKSENFSALYEELMAKFSALESSIDTYYSDLNQLSAMTDAYVPYADSVPSGYPIKDTHITCEYGPRIDPVTGKRNAYHYGLDFSAAYRQDIFTTAPGTVTFAGYSNDFGYNVIIDHGYGYSTRYAHLSKLYVKKGAVVERGDRIGGAGSTGKSTAVHLHYEVYLNGARVNPSDYLK